MSSLSTEISFGKGCITNYNLSTGINMDVFLENVINYPADTYRSRGGLRFISTLPSEPNKIFQDTKTLKIYCSFGSDLYVKQDNNSWKQIFSNLDPNTYHDFVSFSNKIYFHGKNATVYELDTSNDSIVEATYTPKLYLIAPNALTSTSGSFNLIARVGDHGLTVGATYTVQLKDFSSSFGGVGINQSNLIATVISSNNLSIAYSETFSETLKDSGGNGEIIVSFTDVSFPKATLLEQYQNRLYLSGDPNNPDRVYISNIVTPLSEGTVNFDTKESASDIFNLSLDQFKDRASWRDIDTGKYGKIIGLHVSSFGIYIFKELFVYFFQTGVQDSLSTVIASESIVNPRAVDSDGSYLYFVGKNNFYRIKAGSLIAEPIGTPHEYYIKNKDSSRTRVKCWDNQVFITLGDINQLGKPIELVETLDGDSPSLQDIRNISLVYNSRNQTYTFFSNFAPKSFELIIERGQTEFDTNRVLYLNSGNLLVEYDLNYSKDTGKDIPKKIITHIRYASNDNITKKRFSMVYVKGRSLVNLRLFYRLVGTNNTGWEEAKVFMEESDRNMSVFNLNKKIKARAIQFYFGSFDESDTFEIHSYRFKTE